MAERYGSGRLSTERADQFVREQSTHGALLDPRVDLDAIFRDPARRAALQAGELPLPLIEEGELPTTRSGLQDRMREWTDDLFVTNHTRKLLDATVQLYELPNRQRPILRPFLLAPLAPVPQDRQSGA